MIMTTAVLLTLDNKVDIIKFINCITNSITLTSYNVLLAHYLIFVSWCLVFSIVNSRTISHDTQRGGGARWRHTIQYLRYQNIQDIIIKLTYSHSNNKIKKLWLTSQDTSPLLNKVTRAPSDILIGQTHSVNSSHDLPKYLMIHSPFCSINVT